MAALTLTSGPGDSGITTGFWVPLNPRTEERDLRETLPAPILFLTAGEEIRDYFGLEEIPSWRQVGAIIDWWEAHP